LAQQPGGPWRIEQVHHDDRRAGFEGGQRAVQAEHAAQRQGGQQPRIRLAQAVGGGYTTGVRSQRGGAVHDQFGSLGGARGGEQDDFARRVGGVGRRRGGHGRVIEVERHGAAPADGGGRGAARVDQGDAFQVGQGGRVHPGQHGGEVDLAE